jgi:hypothetical protein
MLLLGKTKNRIKVKKCKRKFSRKKLRLRGGGLRHLFKNPVVGMFVSSLLFGLFWKILQNPLLDSTYKFQKNYTPLLLDLHQSLLCLRGFCTFLDTQVGENNVVTSMLYGLHNYIVGLLPENLQQFYKKSFIKVPIVRPNILKLVHYLIENSFDKSKMRDTVLALSSSAEYYNEFLRLRNLDVNQITSMNNFSQMDLTSVSTLNTMFHNMNTHHEQFDEVSNGINAILNTIIQMNPDIIKKYVSDYKFVKTGIDTYQKTSDLIEDIAEIVDNLSGDAQHVLKNGINRTYAVVTAVLRNEENIKIETSSIAQTLLFDMQSGSKSILLK